MNTYIYSNCAVICALKYKRWEINARYALAVIACEIHHPHTTPPPHIVVTNVEPVFLCSEHLCVWRLRH